MKENVWQLTYERVLGLTLMRAQTHAEAIQQAADAANAAAALVPDFNTPAPPEKRGPGRPPKEKSE